MTDLLQSTEEKEAEPRKAARNSLQVRSIRKRRTLRVVVILVAILLVLGAGAYGAKRMLGSKNTPAPFTLPYVQDFSDLDPKLWTIQEGIWAIRDQTLAQVANLSKPASIYVPNQITGDQPYHLSTYITFAKSTQHAGVNFNAQYPKLGDAQQLVYIARNYADLSEAATSDGDTRPEMELVAGYTDVDGNFVEQVQVPFGPDSTEYRLDLYVLGNTYTVQLNGQTLIDRRPLFFKNGLVGYYTLGPARFDTLKVTTAETTEPGEQVYLSDFDQEPGGAGWVPFEGDWEIVDGELVQANPASQDAGIGYEGSAFEEYAVQATFRHLTGAGGGLLFNMVSPYQLVNAQVVRYSDQSDSVFWGFFDGQGQFTRQGFADVEPAGTDEHQLRVFVSADSYDVYLDDQLLARAIALQHSDDETQVGRTGGHIGLVTSRSSVAYSLVEVFPLVNSTLLSPIRNESASPTAMPETPEAQAVIDAVESISTTVVETLLPTVTPAATLSIPTATVFAARVSVTPASVTPMAVATISTVSATPSPTTAITATATMTTPRQRGTSTPLPAVSGLILQGKADLWRGDFRGTLQNAGWRALAGEWRFSNGSLIQDDITGFDLAAVYTRNAFQNYTLMTTFSHRDGNGAGILFNMPYSDRLNGAHMVRYSDRRPGGIFWGYYDDSGKFVGQGYTNVSPPGDARHSIRVVSGKTTYSVYLDDFLLATDLPLMQNYGYVGMVTVQSSADFDGTQVDGIDSSAVVTQTPAAIQQITEAGLYSGTVGFPDERILSGKWEVDAGSYRQTVSDPADYILTTGLYASSYSIQGDIFLPDMPDVGAGFMLQMPERGHKAGATVVRLIKDGQGLFWGVYDESGAFRGRGSVDLPQKPEGEASYSLRVDVNGNSLDIWVDGESIAKDIDLPRPEGWIGLVAFGGPLAFDNVSIDVLPTVMPTVAPR